jgi:hypothetical protein
MTKYLKHGTLQVKQVYFAHDFVHFKFQTGTFWHLQIALWLYQTITKVLNGNYTCATQAKYVGWLCFITTSSSKNLVSFCQIEHISW